MRHDHIPIILAILSLLAGTGTVSSQQPSNPFSRQLVERYEESPSYFHYVLPCGSKVGAGPYNEVPDLCWPVGIFRIQTADGKPAEHLPPVQGVLTVSASFLRFTPNDNNSKMFQDAPIAGVKFEYEPKLLIGAFKTPEGVFGFAFTSFCDRCTSGTSPIDPQKVAQLEAEYHEFGESLTHFSEIRQQIKSRAQMLVGIFPKLQPTVDDLREAMNLYNMINFKFADQCGEPAKSCILAYAKYQACKSNDLSAPCGDAPECSGACYLTGEALRAIKASICTSPNQEGASLFPDWEDFARQFYAKADAVDSNANELIQRAKQYLAKAPGASCTVQGSFVSSMRMHVVEAGAQATRAPGDALPKGVNISAEAAHNLLIQKTPPVYPPIAKAARVSGTVVLNCIIGKDGLIKELSVASGPDMLRQAALDAVQKWVYKPYLFNGEPVEVKTTVNVIFTLGN